MPGIFFLTMKLGCPSFFILYSTNIFWALGMCQTLSWDQGYHGDQVRQVLGTQGTKVGGQGDNKQGNKEINFSTEEMDNMTGCDKGERTLE